MKNGIKIEMLYKFKYLGTNLFSFGLVNSVTADTNVIIQIPV